MIPTALLAPLLAPLLVTLTAKPPIAQDASKAPEFRCIVAVSPRSSRRGSLVQHARQ
jgi:hypothetical protein